MKKTVAILLLVLSLVPILCACSFSKAEVVYTVDEDQIKSICELATLDCFFKNVAKSNKHVNNFLKKDREFWCQYTGVVKVGIDFSHVSLEQNNNEIIITLPQAEVLDVKVNQFGKDDIYKAKGGLFTAEVESDDVIEAMKVAQDEMKDAASSNRVILASARTKAKLLIQDYISTVDEIAGTTHTIKWRFNSVTPDTVEVTKDTPVDLRMLP